MNLLYGGPGTLCALPLGLLVTQAYMPEGGRAKARLKFVTGQWATWQQINFFQDLKSTSKNDAKGLIVWHLIGHLSS